jgi:hypothetical protein
MGIEKIFQALNEYVKLKRTTDSGDQYSFPLLQAKHEVENALVELIDNRIKAYMGRERRRSQSAMAPVEISTVPKDVAMLDALNSAPTPPANTLSWATSDNALTWMENYSRWYHGKRNAAINKDE